MGKANQVARMDEEHLQIIRQNVSRFVQECGQKYDKPGTRLLDIAPQDHEGAAPYFKQATIETLDIDPSSNATYIADLCTKNDQVLPANHFDYIVCTEVLEHTLAPWKAVQEMKRILKPEGLAFVSVPFNFRIHGPLPDCWRISEHGLRALFAEFELVKLDSVETPDRFLMPIHYTLVAKKT